MGKFSGVLLATDYDETLYGLNVGISPENRAAIQYFIMEDGRFTVSTGRSYRNFAIQMEREQLPVNAPVILSNGANIYDFEADAMLYERLMRPEASGDLARLCAQFPDLALEAYCREEVYIHNPNAVTERHLARAGLVGRDLPVSDMPGPWTKAMLQHTDHGLLQRAQAALCACHPEAYEAIFSNAVLLELTAKGVHKGTAVLWLARHLGIGRKHIYCIGNGQNDIPMLEISAVPFAPSNCVASIRERGVTILPSCEESCVAKLIEQLDRRYTKPPESA